LRYELYIAVLCSHRFLLPASTCREKGVKLRTFLSGVPLVLARIMYPLKDRRAGTYYNFWHVKTGLDHDVGHSRRLYVVPPYATRRSLRCSRRAFGVFRMPILPWVVRQA
jgi:hypothetical protein